MADIDRTEASQEAEEAAPAEAETTPPIVEWPHSAEANRPNRVRELTQMASERRSQWPSRLIAGAAGAGLTLVALALRDSLPARRSTPPPPPPSLRRRLAAWLRGEDR